MWWRASKAPKAPNSKRSQVRRRHLDSAARRDASNSRPGRVAPQVTSSRFTATHGKARLLLAIDCSDPVEASFGQFVLSALRCPRLVRRPAVTAVLSNILLLPRQPPYQQTRTLEPNGSTHLRATPVSVCRPFLSSEDAGHFPKGNHPMRDKKDSRNKEETEVKIGG